MAHYPGFDEVMKRENFNVLLDRSRQMILLQWLDFERNELIKDIPALMEYAERERILDYDMIIDVTWSGGGSGGAYAIQRLVDQPFRVTFGNVRLSDLGKARIERYVGREPYTDAPDIFGLNLSRSWLIDWARTDATEAIRRGDEYTPSVPFKLAHLPKDSDGILQPAPVHFSGEVAIINARTWGGSHLDQFMAMYVDDDLATFIGMPTGGYSNTWEGDEVLVLPETGRPLVRFLWSIGHTIRPNGEVLEGNPAQPDNYIPITRDNFQGYHRMLLDTALTMAGGAAVTSASTDRDALISLYNATGGADWTNRTNWLSNSPMGQWYGVTTNDDGRVTELRLLENGLTGPIPGMLGNLSSLNRLNLGDNALTGTIPAELQNLGNLQQFYLWNNRLTGPVPAWLGNLTNLKRLGLSRNRLEGMVPGTLGNLSNLNLINFGGNDLTGPIPTQLQNLGNLEELNLWENRFTGPVPSWLGNLSALTHLALADNLLSGQIPPELGNLTKLEHIHLAGNQLTGCVPESLRHVADNDFLGLILPFCGSSSQPAATEVRRFRDPDVPYLMWEVGPGVPDLHYEYLREGIVHIHRYATPLGLPPLPDDATFYLYADLDLMAQTLARLESWRSLENARQYVADGNWGGLAGLEDEDSGWIMVHLRNVARSGNPSALPHVAAHELSHVYQYTLQNHGRFDNTHSQVRVIGPAWMQEGFAEFHGMAALAHGGIRPYEQRRQEYLGRALRVDVSLKETETYDGLLAGNGRFDLAALAAELLASQSSERALIRYWTLLGPDITWQQAFQTAFGMTIDDFYTRFADHRANGYPTVTLP